MLSPSRAVRQRIAIAVIMIVGLGVLALLAPFAGGLLLALVLNVLASPVYAWLTRRMPPGVAATLVIVGLLLLIIAPAAWLAGIVITQLPDAARHLQQTGVLSSLSTLRLGPIDIGSRLSELGATAAGWIAAQATSLLGSAASTVLDLLIALFGVYYLLRAGNQTWATVRPFIPFSAEHADELLARFEMATRATLLGSVLIAVIQGSLVGIGFYITGLPSALFWGVVATVASVLPVFGSAIVWVPGVLALFFGHQVVQALALAAFCAIIVSNIDNVVRPIVTQRMSDVHPMITLVGAFAGLPVFGLLGLLLGPLSISYFFVLLRMYNDEYADGVQTASPAEHQTDSSSSAR